MFDMQEVANIFVMHNTNLSSLS